jgi:hypothetical protein
MNKTEGTFEGWCILELMGHRKLGGFLLEQSIGGASFLRIDVCDTNGKPTASQLYNPSAVYCITPTTQEIAISYGANNIPQPVTRWELPALKAVETRNNYDDDDEDNNVDSDFYDREVEEVC